MIKQIAIRKSVFVRVYAFIILISTAVLMGFGAMDYFRIRSAMYSDLDKTSIAVANRLENTLAGPLWEILPEEINKIIEAEMAEDRIYAIFVRQPDDQTIMTGRMRGDTWDVIPASNEITGTFNSKKIQISKKTRIKVQGETLGYVEVYFTTRFLEAALWASIVSILIKTLVLDLMLLVFLLIVFQRTIIKPVMVLINAAIRIGQEEFDTRIPIRSNDEFGLLAKTLNSMGLQLSKSFSEREKLFHKLKQRTAALDENRLLLQAIIDNSIAVIYLKDLEGKYILVNRRFEELFHVEDKNITGMGDHDIFPSGMADAFHALDQKVLDVGAPIMAEEVAPHDDGPHTYISIKAPLLDTGGTPYAICGISTDITERKRAEEEIQRLNSELLLKITQLHDAQEELVRKEKLSILGQLAGSVGHEIRNPLGVMSNAVYFLKLILSEADVSVTEYLDIIKQEIDNAQRIITDLLDFARTKAPRTKATSPLQLVNDSLDRCVIPDGVELQIEIPADLPLLWIDPLQMGQVMQNLITNAVQAMPQGGELSISARQVTGKEGAPPDPGMAFLELCVKDTGEGISPENKKKLFQPLFTTKAKGIGLGLVVCRNLTEANGGRISVESEQGVGTTFTVVLPSETE